jgi:hypothetical protein
VAKRRKLTADEKLSRQMDRKAAAMNARALRAVGGPGSLFAAEAGPAVTRDDAYWNWRFQKSRFAEGGDVSDLAVRRMDWVRLGAIEARAAELLGPDVAAEISRRVRGTFGGVDYICNRWRSALVDGKPTFRLEREEYQGPVTEFNRTGVRVRVLELEPLPAAGPVMTAAEWEERFPPFWSVKVVDGDDDPAGLFPLVMAALGVS